MKKNLFWIKSILIFQYIEYCLTTIIYKNLSLTSQLKLQKANSSIKSEIEKAFTLTDIDKYNLLPNNLNIDLYKKHI